MRIRSFIFMMIILLITGAGCSNIAAGINELSPYEAGMLIDTDEQRVELQEGQATLTIWAPEHIVAGHIEAFNESHPNVQVDVVEVSHRDMMTEYMQAINEHRAPDIVLIHDHQLGRFSGLHGFVNLLDRQSADPQFFADMPAGLMKNGVTFQGDQLFAMPMLAFPYVTFYRADVLDELGFPSDPQQLGNYLSQRENWLSLAHELKDEGRYMVESIHSLLVTINRLTHYFDEELNYLPGQGAVQQALEVAVDAKDFAMHVNIWEASGQQALQNGELVMLFAPSYLQYNLQEWVPDQAGKWKVTHLPFGMHGVDQDAGLSLAISAYSQNIDLAWEFVKLAATGVIHMYGYEHQDPFFGEQDVNEIFRQSLEADSPGQPTPLDHYASELWELHLYKFMMGASITEKSLAAIEEDVMERIRIEQRLLLNFIK